MKLPRFARNYRELGTILRVRSTTLSWWAHACDDAPKSRPDGRHSVAEWQEWIADNAADLDICLTPQRLETIIARLRVERVRCLAAHGVKLHKEMRHVEESITSAHESLASKLEGLAARVGAMVPEGEAKELLGVEIAEIVRFLRHPGQRRPWERKITATHPAYFDGRRTSRTGRRRKRQ